MCAAQVCVLTGNITYAHYYFRFPIFGRIIYCVRTAVNTTGTVNQNILLLQLMLLFCLEAVAVQHPNTTSHLNVSVSTTGQPLELTLESIGMH
jgi:hypothetical protein